MSKVEEIIKEMAGEGGSEIDPTDFDNLDLADVEIKSFSPEDKAYLEKFTNVDNLIMLGCELSSLENFPELTNIKRLELSENAIKGSDLVHLKKLTGLVCLNIAANKIERLDDLKALKDLPELINIDLTENKVSEIEDFDKKVRELLPKLEIVNRIDAEGNE